MTADPDRLQERVLVCAPRGRDAPLTCTLLDREGLACEICPSVEDVSRKIGEGAGVALLTEEVFSRPALALLTATREEQPAWSDFPLIVLTRSGEPGPDDLRRLAAFAPLGNVTFVERPVRKATVVSAVRAALRARRRQYQVRDHLEEREQTITQRRRAEEQLRFQARLLDTVGQAAVATDPDGVILYWNRFAETLYGWTKEEALGRNVADVIIAPAAAGQAAEIMAALQRGQGWSGEFLVRRRDGTTFPAQVTDAPVFDDHGVLEAVIGVSTDISEQKRAEEALREADRQKDEFLATLAHELRNPLAPIRNGLQLMGLARDDGAVVERARAMMERQLGQMVRLIDDLLDVSRITRGKIELRKGRLELAAVVQSALEISRPLVEANGHELRVALPPEPVFLDGDLTRLSQVFSNLLNNSARYTQRGGQISLAAELQGAEVVVTVCDTGIGIPAAMLPHIFEMFTQGNRPPEGAQGGLGVGLTLVQRLVELHGGTVEARSDGPDQGSELVVRLPVAPAVAGERPEPAVPAPQGAPGPKCRVLVVDDNEDSADSMGMLLQLRGYELRTAYDGLAGVAAAAEFRPAVVILDIGMPGLNGYDAARRIRSTSWGQDMVLIALTGWGQADDKLRAREAGFDHHLTKPVSPAGLEELLAEVAPGQLKAITA
ncbi:MAG TPA: ATP-binding protein [Thermoanaerobaculia bacterium]|nr:ATP-binding protein [Thermoanaerobaculia bacterium]